MQKRKGSSRKKAFIFWLLTAVYMGIIFVLSSLERFRFPGLFAHSDKVAHMLLYAPLAFLLYFSLKKSGMKQHVFPISFMCALVYGLSDEFHQGFVPGRVPAMGDFIADSVGALIGSFGASLIKNTKNANE